MSKLFFSQITFEAEKIIKTDSSIIGYNRAEEVFAFRGIVDFSLFSLGEGQEYDVLEPSETELLQEYVVEVDFRVAKIELGL